MNTDYVDMLEEDDDMEGKTRFTFKTIKGKPNKNPANFAMIWNDECPEVQFESQTCLRIRTGSPVEFRALSDFCHNFLGDFPCKSPYVYIPKSVLVQQSKQKKKKKSLFKDV